MDQKLHPEDHNDEAGDRPAPLNRGQLAQPHRTRLVELFSDEIDAKMQALANSEGRKGQEIFLEDTVRLTANFVNKKFMITICKLGEKDKIPVDIIGEFKVIQRDDDSFEIYHRIVESASEYRKQGYGSVMLHAAECFARHYAKSKPVRLYAEVGQAEVMEWFEKRGYLPVNRDAIAQVQAGLASGELETGVGGFVYVKGTPPSEQAGPLTAEKYRRRFRLEKKL